MHHHIDHTIAVSIDHVLGGVTITDLSGFQEEIYLDPLQAEDFAAEVKALMASDMDMPQDTAELIAATPYAENFWN